MELMKFSGRVAAAAGAWLACILLVGCEASQPSYKFDPLAENAPPPAAGAAPMKGGQGGTVAASNADNPVATLLQIGDEILVSFADTPNPIPAIVDSIKEDGSIILIYNQKFQAAGKTIGRLQAEIHDRYVPTYFKYLTVSIKPQDRFFNVSGEVRNPGRSIYIGRTTVLRAITIAGGFTDFSRKSKVLITRAGGKILHEDCSKALLHPELDLEVFPGDEIHVYRRLW